MGDNRPREKNGFLKPTVEEPSMELLEEWSYEGLGETTDGCMGIENDSECEHGHVAWMRYLEQV